MNTEFRKILQIGLPAIIAWAGHIAYNIVDNIMIGKILGSKSLAVSGVASAVYFIFLVFGLGASGIINPLISSAIARRKKLEVRKVFQNSVVYCLVIGFTLWFLIFFGAGYIVPFVNKQHDLNSDIIAYVKVLSFASIFTMIFFLFEKLCEGVGKTKPAMYTVFLCNISNIILNYVFLTGSFGAKNFGVVGAAVSTLINAMLECVILYLLIRNKKEFKYIFDFKKILISVKELKNISLLGLPGGFLLFFESCAFNIATFIASIVSVYDIAAHQLLLWLINAFLTPLYGFSSAITSRIAFNLSVNKIKLSATIGYISIVSCIIYILCAMAIFYSFGSEILSLMLKGEENDTITINLVLSIIPALIIIEVLDALQIVSASVLRGYKDTKIPAIFGLISYFGFCIPFAYIFGINYSLGVYGIWVGLGVGLVVQSTLLVIRFVMLSRKVAIKK